MRVLMFIAMNPDHVFSLPSSSCCMSLASSSIISKSGGFSTVRNPCSVVDIVALLLLFLDFVVCGLRFMVYGLWFMVYGLWFMVYDSWIMVYGLWFTVYDLRFMVYGLWFTVYGLRFMVYGLWFMVYGLWFMVYGLWFGLYAPIRRRGGGRESSMYDH